MPNWLWLVLLVAGYIWVTQWVLPRMGIPT